MYESFGKSDREGGKKRTVVNYWVFKRLNNSVIFGN
jgi:hypothetical protein